MSIYSWQESWNDSYGYLWDHQFGNSPKKDPGQDYFYAGDAMPAHANIPDDKTQAILSTVGALSLFIPEVGPIIFGTISIVSLFLNITTSNKISQMSPEEASKAIVKALQEAIADYFDKESIEKGKKFIASVKDTVKRWVDEGVFMYSTLDHDQRMNEVLTNLKLWTGGDADQSSYNDVIETLRGKFKWRDNEIQTMLMSLMTMYGQCMELECVLYANLAVGAEAAGHTEMLMSYKTAFHDKLKEMRTFFNSQANEFETWIEQQKDARRSQLDGSVHYDKTLEFESDAGVFGLVTYHHQWDFEDRYSKTKIEFYVREVNGSEKGDSRKDMGRQRDDRTKIMQEMRNWNAELLQVHVDKHFEVFERVIKRWTNFGEQLDTYLLKLGTKSIDGTKLFENMQIQ